MRKSFVLVGLAPALLLTFCAAPCTACPMCGKALAAQPSVAGSGNPALGFAVGGAALLATPFALATGFGAWFYRLARRADVADENHSTPAPPAHDAGTPS